MKKQKIKKKQLKIENKGITLIALVITIIVLLILAAITISSLIGDNSIIGKTNEAVIQTNLGTVKEAYDMYQTENYELSKKDFTKLLKKVPVGEEGEYVYVIQDLSELKLDNLGEYGIGEIPESISDILDFNNLYIVDENDNVSYVLDGKIYGGIELAKEEEGEVIYSLKSKAFIGDYISYDCGNGYNGLWQVLYNDVEHGLQIISCETVGKLDIGVNYNSWNSTKNEGTWQDVLHAYDEALDKLNNYCSVYMNEEYGIEGRCVDDADLEMLNFIKEVRMNILDIGEDYWLAATVDIGDGGYTHWDVLCYRNRTGFKFGNY